MKYTWKLPGSLGLKLMQRGDNPDDPRGVQVSGFTDSCADETKASGIEKGMVIVKLNGDVVEAVSYKDLVAKIKVAGRPLKMNFSAAMELVNGLKAKAQKLAAIAKKQEELAQLATDKEEEERNEDPEEKPTPPPAPLKASKEEEARKAKEALELENIVAHRDPVVHRLAEDMRELNVRLEEVQLERLSCPRKGGGKSAKKRRKELENEMENLDRECVLKRAEHAEAVR